MKCSNNIEKQTVRQQFDSNKIDQIDKNKPTALVNSFTLKIHYSN